MKKDLQHIFNFGAMEGVIATELLVKFRGQPIKQCICGVICYIVFRFIAELLWGKNEKNQP